MKQKDKRPRLIRVSDAFLPITLMLYAAFCPESIRAVNLYISYLSVAALSLFACRGLRIAFARQPSIRAVRGSVHAALLLTLAGGLLSALLYHILIHRQLSDIAPMILSSFFLNIEHIFYEYMYAVMDRYSATLSRGITSILTLTGLFLCGTGDLAQPECLVITTFISMMVSCVVSLALGVGQKGRINAQIIKATPRAGIQTILYPCSSFVMVYLYKKDVSWFSFFAGLAIYELCKTPFRRSKTEAKHYNIILLSAMLFSVISVILINLFLSHSDNHIIHEIEHLFVFILLSSLCSIVLYGNV